LGKNHDDVNEEESSISNEKEDDSKNKGEDILLKYPKNKTKIFDMKFQNLDFLKVLRTYIYKIIK